MRTCRFDFNSAVLLACAVALTCLVGLQPGCNSTPAQRQALEYPALLAIGITAKAGIQAVAVAKVRGDVTDDKWRSVSEAYDLGFQPAFAISVAFAKATPAPDVSAAQWADLAKLEQYRSADALAEATSKP